ncbi:MAG TPA: condensation domain-containing protein, partial [Isosphaeraceae bacterium]|nr:condensation domain-containing protein [Isosphaeraceae bacterium]
MVTRGLAGIENAGHSANRWVDLDPSLSLESSLDQLASELLDPGDEPFVAFRDGQRYVAARNLAANGDGPADGENGAIPALRCVEPADRRKLIQDAARSELARTLRLPEHAIEVDRPMVSFGLDSLMAIQLKNRLEAQAGVSISIVKLLEGLTVAQLAAEIDQTLSATLDRPESENGVTPNGHHGGTVGSHRNGDELNLDFPPRDASIDRIEDRSSLDQDEQDAGLVPLSEGQRALWFVYQLAPQSPAYNFVYAARIASDIVEWALRKAVGILFERHPLLRSTFSMPGRTPLYRDHDRINPAVEIIDAARWTRADLIEQVRAAAHLPFDLENGPCVRIALYRAGPGESVLSLAVHHILADLWSMNLLVDELRVLYAEVLAGRPTKLPAPSARYADYVRWQRDWLVGRQGALAWKFWKAALADAPPSLDLPADRPRPKVQTYRGSAVSCPIDPDQFARLRDLAAREQTTLFVVLLSAFLVLLRRYTGQDDLVIGTATAGRGRPEWERVVGYFLNQVPLRVRVDVQSDFVDLIRRAQRVVLSALEHQDFPFSVMVERLRPARDPSRPPIFQVMFIWDKSIEFSAQQPSDSHPFGAGRPIEPLVMEQCGAPFDLTLIVFENGSDLSASIRYNVDLFDATTIERMAGHFRSLLSGIVDDARRPVGELPVLSPEETSHVLGGTDGSGNKQARQLRPFPLLFEDQVERSPAATAVVFDG